jgi:hypothetical protein
MGIFKRKSRKDKRGITPAPSTSSVMISVETYDLTGDEPVQTASYTVYEAPEPSYDRSPTTYDTPTYTAPSYSSSDSSSSYSGDSGSSYSGGDW